MDAPIINVNVAVEGALDEAVAQKLIAHAGEKTGAVYGRERKHNLRQRIRGFNRAVRHTRWIVLTDLDNDADCAPPLPSECLPHHAPLLCFRIAIRKVEAWLTADAETLSKHLSVQINWISPTPESLKHPKDKMVNLSRRSRGKDVRKDMVPRERSGRRVGSAYPSRDLSSMPRTSGARNSPLRDRRAYDEQFPV